MRHSQYSQCASLTDSQRGSSLIAVLLILLVITILAVTAMRQGLMSLNISTHAQVRQLVVQSADAVQSQITQSDVSKIVSLTGVLGVALANSEANPGQEYVFCYRPTVSNPGFGRAQSANVIKGVAGSDASIVDVQGANFCDLTKDFGSGRQAVVTQVAVTIPTDAQLTPGTSLATGVSLGQGTQVPKNLVSMQRIRATATAMLPAFATSSISDVQTKCLGATNGSTAGQISDNSDASLVNTETLTDCLARYGVPASTQVQEYNLTTSLN